MYVANGGSNVKWGGTDFKWGGRAPLASPLATALVLVNRIPVKQLFLGGLLIAFCKNLRNNEMQM